LSTIHSDKLANLEREAIDSPLRHVAIIMDGNNRWANERGLTGLAGHRAGVENVRNILEACRYHGVETLTLFAFSSENWQRPASEVRGLMSLFAMYIRNEVKDLCKRNVRLRVIGQRTRFSNNLCKRIKNAEALTATGELNLVLAVDYGGRWDITQAARSIADQACRGEIKLNDINEEIFSRELCLGNLAPPDLCIRTAGEQRISNFLLWHLAYTELYFAGCYWPDFDELAFSKAVEQYRGRKRRFGLSSGQTQVLQKESA
jgi:undecaprenyl diphosphate synthase